MLLTRNKAVRQVFGLLETANFLSLKLWWKNPGAIRVYPNMVFRAYHDLAKFDRWHSKSIFEAMPETNGLRVTIEPADEGGISVSLEELCVLALITRALNPTRIFEIGTYRGRTALLFAMNAPENCTVYTLDLDPSERKETGAQSNAADAMLVSLADPGQDFRGRPEEQRIRQLYGNSTRFDFSPYHGTVDLVFVDGGHDFVTAKSDTEAALRMVKPGGVILWHDFGNYGDYNDVIRGIFACIPPRDVIWIRSTQLAMYRRPS